MHLYKTVDGVKTEYEGFEQIVRAPAEGHDNWSYTWGDSDELVLYVYENGKQVTYSVEETLSAVPEGREAYEVSYDKTSLPAVKNNSGTVTVTNTHESEKIDVKVTKVWNDQNDRKVSVRIP